MIDKAAVEGVIGRADKAFDELAATMKELMAHRDNETKRADGWMILKRERDDERAALRAERDAMREHIKNLEAERDRWRSRWGRSVKDRYLHATRGDSVDPLGAPVENAVKAPEIAPEYAKKAVKETFGDTLYDAFMRGARAEIIGELQATDEERFPR